MDFLFLALRRSLPLVWAVLLGGVLLLEYTVAAPADAAQPTPPPQATPRPIRVQFEETVSVAPGGSAIFERGTVERAPTYGRVSAVNRAPYAARIGFTHGDLRFAVAPGLIAQVLSPRPGTSPAVQCASPADEPHVMSCTLPIHPFHTVVFTAVASLPVHPLEAALDLGEVRPCIPEAGTFACDSVRLALWQGEPDAWAVRGVGDSEERFREIIVLRARAGDPATIAAIAQVLGLPYLKITRFRFVGVDVGQSDEFVEVTNLGGGTQSLTRWALWSPERGTVFLGRGLPLAPGASCRVGWSEQPGAWCGPLNAPVTDVWPDAGGRLVFMLTDLGLVADDVWYSAGPESEPPPPNLRLVPSLR